MSSSDENDPPQDKGAGANESQQSGEVVSEGKRVVRKRRKRKTDASRQTLYLKKKEILREMETEEDPHSVKAQIERLKEAARKDEKPMEEKWGSSSHRRRGSRWVIFAVCAIAVPLVVFLVVWSITHEGGGKMTTGGGDTGINLDVSEGDIDAYDRTSPQAWFHENSVKAFDVAIGLLEEVNAARHPAQLSAILRDYERVSRGMTLEDADGWVGFSLGDPRTLSWEYGEVGETGYMVLMGRRVDYTQFRAYFVKTEEGLKLDWEATQGVSDVPVSSLVAEGGSKTLLVRGWVGKQPHYDMDKGRASIRSWYVILDAAKEEFVWAYAPTGSRLDRQFRDILSYGRMVEMRPNEVRATVRLTKPSSGFRDNEFEIQELVNSDWVAP